MVLTSVAVLSSNEKLSDMVVNVFQSNSASVHSPFTVLSANTFEADVEREIIKLTSKADSDLILELSNVADKRFAEPSSPDNQMMTLDFKANKDAKVYNLTLKLVGTESSNVGRVSLIDGKKIVAVGQRDGEYFHFNGINMDIKSGEAKALILKVSLGSALKPSDRFRMDIENPEDIQIKVEGRNYELGSDFPMKGSYLTVSKNRLWGPFKSKKDE